MLARMYIKNPPYVDKNCDEVRATLIENIVAGSSGGSKVDDKSIGAAREGHDFVKA
jgi:hypothetical protein